MNDSTGGSGYEVAVLIPCFNEENTILKVVEDFGRSLPSATVYVYDNNSTDATVDVAGKAGAIVRKEIRQGKGEVIRRMFADVEADIYVLVDGDDTYDANGAPAMINKLLDDELDMVVGSRLGVHDGAAFRHGHYFGNRMLTGFVSILFRRNLVDMLSGYRVFSRRFVKSFPALASGFETETELTIHAFELRMPIDEVALPYGARPEGSESKLRTYRDGMRILVTILVLFKEERPLIFFSLIAGFLAVVSLLFGYPVVTEYLETGLVPRFPTAILATGIMLLAFLSLTCGFILDTVTHGRRELKRLAYLSTPRISK